MALIEVRGYVNKPAAREGKSKFSTFTLSEKQKDRNGNPFKVFYNVTDFKNPAPPAESAYVTVKGYLNVRDYEKDGVKRQSLDISAQSLEVAPGREPTATPAAPADAVDEWSLD